MRLPRGGAAVIVASCMIVLASGCGARWSNAQRQAVLARAQGSGSGGTAARSSTASNGGSGATTTLPGATSGGANAGTAGGGTADAGANGAAGGGADAAAGPLPCAAHSDAPGVTDDTITVGNISTLSGPIPGLGASAVGATRSYIAYLNANGGVCGRKVELKSADDGEDNGTYRSVLTQMEPSVLGLVGQDGGGDAGGADIYTAKNIPVVSTAFSTQAQDSPTFFDVNPPYRDTSQSSGKYRWLKSQGANTVALVYIAVDQSRDQIVNTEEPLIRAAGMNIVSEQALPLSTLNYDSAARGVANSHADYMLFLGGYEQNSSMATSMAGTGYKLKFADYYTTYGTKFIDQAGSAAEGAISFSFALPVEDGGANPEQAKFLQWMQQTAPDAAMDVFAFEAWAADKAFFDALQQLPGSISRQALIDELHTFNNYDAGGFYGRIDLGNENDFGCEVGMQVVNGKWQRLVPDQGFLC